MQSIQKDKIAGQRAGAIAYRTVVQHGEKEGVDILIAETQARLNAIIAVAGWRPVWRMFDQLLEKHQKPK